MKLYYAPGVCSQSPHIALREAGLEFTLEKVDLRTKVMGNGGNYLEINPNGYVPALEIEPGVVLTEGPAIVQYIADQAPGAALAPPAGSLARYRLQSWLNFISTEIHKGYSPLFKPDFSAETKELVKVQLAKRLGYVDQVLAKQETLMESGYSVADIYLFVVTGWSGMVGVDLTPFPALQAFRQRMLERPAVKAALVAEGLAK